MNTKQIKQLFSLKIVSSRGKYLLLTLPHLLVLIILLWFLDYRAPTIYMLLLSLFALIISYIYFYKLHLTLSLDKSIHAIHKQSNDTWILSTKTEDIDKVRITDTSYVSNQLIILNYIDDSNINYTVLIPADSVEKEVFRKLKVLIKTNRI